MRRKAGGAVAEPAYYGAADEPVRRGVAAQGALEIEFEDDDDTATATLSPAGRSRDLRPAALTALATVILGAALWATHGTTPPNAGNSANTATAVPPDYAAYVVTVAYKGSHLLSAAQRRIEVDLRVAPAPGARVKIIAYYVSENGVTARADPPPSVTPLPASGTDVKLDLTVTDCATVPIGESMGFVDVIADGPAGVIDRFTILGDRYSTDLARMLRQLCPGRTSDPNQSTIGVVVAGS